MNSDYNELSVSFNARRVEFLVVEAHALAGPAHPQQDCCGSDAGRTSVRVDTRLREANGFDPFYLPCSS